MFFLDFEQPDGVSREFTPEYDAYLGGSRPDDLEYISVAVRGPDREGAVRRDRLSDHGPLGHHGRRTLLRLHLRHAQRPRHAAVQHGLRRRGPRRDQPRFSSRRRSTTAARCSSSTRRIDSTTTRWATSRSARAIDSAPRTASRRARIRCRRTQIICALPDEFQYFPDTTTNYEVGLRSQWADGRLTLNGALYYIDWQDPQLASVTVNGAQPITKNGEGAETSGIEIALDADVTDRLNLGFSYSHSKAELTEVAPDLIREFTPPGFGPGSTTTASIPLPRRSARRSAAGLAGGSSDGLHGLRLDALARVGTSR